MNKTRWTEADFAELSWHDCQIRSIALDREGEWQGDLVMEIDFITDWLCGADRSCRFRVAPATLRFANVDNLRLDVSLKFKQPLEIYSVERRDLPEKNFRNFRWTIKVQNYPEEKENLIAFDATGFTQQLTGYPIETQAQSLTEAERKQSRKDWRTTSDH